MVEIQLGVGASVDIASGDEISERFDGLEGILKGKRVPLPIRTDRSAAYSVAAGGGEQYVSLGKPPTGRLWEVTGITVCGADSSTSVATAKVAIYFGDSYFPPLTGLRVPNLAVPSFLAVGSNVLWCQSNEEIVAGISGTSPVGTIISVNVTLNEWVAAEVSAHNGR